MLEKYRSKLDSERILLLTFVGIAVYMFAESFTFNPDAANFPQIMAGSVVVLGLLLLFRSYLPESVREYLLQEQTIDPGAMGDEDVADELEESGEDTEIKAETLDRPLHPSVFTALATTIYLLGGYLFGFFWMTPVLTVGYLWWFKQSLPKIAIVTVIAMGAVFGFVEFLNMPFLGGELI